jgi:hypothetical protein
MILIVRAGVLLGDCAKVQRKSQRQNEECPRFLHGGTSKNEDAGILGCVAKAEKLLFDCLSFVNNRCSRPGAFNPV